jgi:hypothetical protein
VESRGAGGRKLSLSRVSRVAPPMTSSPRNQWLKNTCGAHIMGQEHVVSPGLRRAKLSLSRGFQGCPAYDFIPQESMVEEHVWGSHHGAGTCNKHRAQVGRSSA